ncbi:fasciclin domain-containing protein [Winogradskyella maritima]|uniref:Fasciclin domain-containing protein n=1 Tax=Winogradskyella maritima TaxID=1517766 RepID=A0ABV8AKE7_9FLAO|nr:fasciclin domain-containing protein [Winogradskyella maritima]
MVTFQSCDSDDDNTPMPSETTVVDVAVDANFTVLADALTRANLVTTLEEEGPFTVFAPTNQAFQDLLDSNNNWNSLDDIPLNTLTEVLLNHVIIGENIPASTLIGAGSGYETTGASGPESTNLSLYFNVVNGVVQLNGGSSTDAGANVITPDQMADNGVVHVINKVLLPPTTADHAIANPALSVLVDALVYADTQDGTDLVATLSQNSTFTTFAPTNDAFLALLSELGVSALTDIDAETVEAVLLTHVITNANVTSGELTTGMVATLGGNIMVDAGSLTITDPRDREINIVPSLVDIQGSNGVVHVVDRVILPAE